MVDFLGKLKMSSGEMVGFLRKLKMSSGGDGRFFR